jgi:cyclophilin family peptidyl-prolyl cis-trans isomerase
MGHDSWRFLLDADRPDLTVTHRCYLDVATEGGRGGRLVLGLYGNAAPKTVENFRALCTGERGDKLHYKGSPLHRIIPGFMAQGGDITLGNGMGGASIYGETFAVRGPAACARARGCLFRCFFLREGAGAVARAGDSERERVNSKHPKHITLNTSR